MSLSDLASVGSFVSGVAVLASLVFLYVQLRQLGQQIRQAERNQRASMRTARTSRTVDALSALMEPSMADTVAKGNAATVDLSPAQCFQYAIYCISRFMNAEDAFEQRADGLLSEAAFAGMVASLTG